MPVFNSSCERVEIPILALEYGNADIRVQKHEIWSQPVKVGLDVDFPLLWKVLVEKIEYTTLTLFQGLAKSVEIFAGR